MIIFCFRTLVRGITKGSKVISRAHTKHNLDVSPTGVSTLPPGQAASKMVALAPWDQKWIAC